jgi:putative hydrolase of the HAD superfamily
MQDDKQFCGPMKDWPAVAAIPGARETLAALQEDWRLSLATNADLSTEADIRTALRRVDLDPYLERIFCFQNIGLKKPALGFYRHVLEDLGVPTERVFMVGDNFEADVQGANAAGIRAIWLNRFTGEDRSGDLFRTIHSLADLPGLLAGLETAA